MPLRVFNAANTQIPAYLALIDKGLAVRREWAGEGDTAHETWIAEGTLGTFAAEDPVSLLGIVAMTEVRGEHWAAPDEAINHFLGEFYPDDA